MAKDDIRFFVIEESAAPFQITKYQTDEISGIIVDIVNKVVSTQFDVSPVIFPFPRLEAEMKKHNKSNWVTYGSTRWSPLYWQNLSNEHLFYVEHKVVTKKGFTYQGIQDLHGKKIALIKGFHYPSLDGLISRKKIEEVRFKDHYAAIEAVLMERVSAFPAMDKRIYYHMKRSESFRESLKLHDFSDVISNYKIHLNYSLGIDKNKKKAIDKEIKKLRNKGGIERILSKYRY